MGLPDFSGFDTIKQAYRDKAKQYHPDVNPSNEADDIFKLVNEAYQVLSDPQTKNRFDYALKYSLNYHHRRVVSNVDPAEAKRREFAERIKRAKEIRKQKYLRRFERGDIRFPYRYRMAILILGAVSAFLLSFKHWFVNEAVVGDAAKLGMCLVAFIFLWMIFCNQLYRYWRYHHLKFGKHPNYEINVVRWMVVVLIVSPLLVNILSQYRKEYELNHFGVEQIADVTRLYAESEVQYTYTVNGVKYLKTVQIRPGIKMDSDFKWVAIVYSKESPEISDLNLSK